MFSFVDISATGTQLTFFDADNLSVPNADDGVATNVPLGFAFFFAGRTFTTVNMSTNGFLHFELNGESDSSANRCPIPDAVGRFVPKNFIAVLWDNLILSNPGSPGRGGYTQQFASCPNASGGTGPCTVFMWDNADHAGGAVESFDVEAILYANGNILMQYGPGNPEAGAGSTTAVAAVSTDMEAAQVYACDMYGSIAADRAVLFARNISVGTVRISEFRLRGPNGSTDEFVEIYSTSGLTVGTTDGSAGWAVVASSNTTLNDGSPAIKFIIPNGTAMPAGRHYLGVNAAGYSLGAYPSGNGTTATGDATYTDDIPDNAGIALFRTANPANFTLANRLDAVGSAAEANPIYREGAGYPALTPVDIDYAFARKRPGGCTGSTAGGGCNSVPRIRAVPGPGATPVEDSDNNASDFIFVDTNGIGAGAGLRLGAPGPENLSAPIDINGGGPAAFRLDACKSSYAPPNVVRAGGAFCAAPNPVMPPCDPAQNSTFGTLDIRLNFTNSDDVNITRLRFRVVDITTSPSIPGVADLRPMTSADLDVGPVDRPPSCGGGTSSGLVRGTTLEQPPTQVAGSGFNGSLSVGAITPAAPLLRNASVNVRFVLGVEQMGAVRFCVVAEMLPSNSRRVPVICFIGSTEKVMRVRTDFNGDGSADVAMYRPSTGRWSIRNQGMVQFGEPGDVPVSGDYDGDGDEDIAVYRPSTAEWLVRDQFTVQWGARGDVPIPGDFDGDGTTDVAVYRPSTGDWLVRNQFTVNFGGPGQIPVAGDYDGDGTDDVAVFQPSTGTWTVRNQMIVDIGVPGDRPVPGDYDDNGTTDIAIYRPSTGQWFIRGQPTVQYGDVGDIPAPADYNGDGKMDTAVYRPSTRTWFTVAAVFQFGEIGDIPVPLTPGIPLAIAGDYDGDGATDIAVHRPSTNQWFVRNQLAVQFGDSGDVPVPADYNGDRRMDVAIYRPSTGYWYARDQVAVQFGDAGDKPMPRDYNGDGLMDVAVYRPSTGYWYVRDQFTVQFGDAGDIPLPGDYNGDRAADVAVYRPSSGQWFVRNQFTAQFGDPGDIPVPADYNGDGKTDVAVYRPSTGTWYVHNQFSVQFGAGGDLAVPGDYNGDGVTDIAVYRPSTGQWFVRNLFTAQFGDPADVPMVRIGGPQ